MTTIRNTLAAILVSLAGLVAGTVPSQSAAFFAWRVTDVPNGDTLNVRADPSSKSQILVAYPNGTLLSMTGPCTDGLDLGQIAGLPAWEQRQQVRYRWCQAWVDPLCNGNYQDEGDLMVILAGASGGAPGVPFPAIGGGTVNFPVNFPDELAKLMITNPNIAGLWPFNIETMDGDGAKGNEMQFIVPPVPFLANSGFQFAFGAITFDTNVPGGATNPTFRSRWTKGATLQID